MGPNVPGELLIYGALAANVVAGFGFFTLARGNRNYETLARRAYHAFTLLVALASGYLYYLFYTHNYAFKYVYEYSERAQPAFYILAAFWGGQEGTYLLWLLFAALFGYIILKRGGQYTNHAMVVYSISNLFFLLILTRVSPFAMLPTPAPDGLGLNPLLRDPWMVVHPPVMFIGYAMAAVPFAIALAALLTNDYSGWLKRVFPWVAITSLALGAGNVLGGFWAYKTLGWGGFWGWDPVENSSFVPWLISLALLHGMILERRSGALRKTNILLTAFVYLLVIYGTFLTRSGVLADFSVHSFTDLGINGLLIGFMGGFVLLTLGLFLWRMLRIPVAPLRYNYYGREFSLFAGMVMLLIFGVVVLFWMSLPLLTKLVGAEPRAADVSTYNGFALPLVILMAFLVAVSPKMDYSEYKPTHWGRKLFLLAAGAVAVGFGLFYEVIGTELIFAALFTLIAAGMGMYLLKRVMVRSLAPALAVFIVTIVVCLFLGVKDYLFLLFFATALMAATSNLIALTSYLPSRWSLMGGQLTHFGFGLLLVGILASSAFGTSDKLVIPRGDKGAAFGRTLEYKGMAHDMNYPYNELLLSLDENGSKRDIRPQLYFSERMQGTMRKPYVDRSLFYDLYMAPEQIESGHDHAAGLVLSKGEIKRIGDMEIHFKGYTLGGHGGDTSSSGMQVAAMLDIDYKGTTTPANPSIVYEAGAEGQTRVVDHPATVKAGDKEYMVSVSRVLADQGEVELSIPGLTDAGGSNEKLVLDVSKKPLINLVWAGSVLILLGAIIVFLRRRQELNRPEIPSATISKETIGTRTA